VVITDDGVATGSTMLSALWAARRENPSRLVCALPVAPEETAAALAEACDTLVVLRVPPDFYAVGQFYANFEQLSDEEALAALRPEKEAPWTMSAASG
jgi:predicted phosphoribosyltransferase